ncbi:response regulator [Halotalea alkalilenta]|uniref:DNA-binding response regulator n=1 Tax=Halotalea alkalilenta TaxID=376489 RepID=A0A172YC62_9GAMM|nr:response regulator [Halotalea alkalilenta]ANF56808.1 DNA-binding response regulator [Halotalea alkalilenta]
MRILLVEDHPSLSVTLTDALRASNWAVDACGDGLTAQTMLETERYTMLLLDIGLPGLDGFALLSWLRRRDSRLPVLLISARGNINDRVKGLNLGADDYLVKPFSLSELEARINAVLRRTRHDGQRLHHCGALAYDTEDRQFTLGQRPLALTQRELAVLEILISRSGRIVSKEQLAGQVFCNEESGSFDAIEVYIHRLRKKLASADVRIVTFRGLGYQLEAMTREAIAE